MPSKQPAVSRHWAHLGRERRIVGDNLYSLPSLVSVFLFTYMLLLSIFLLYESIECEEWTEELGMILLYYVELATD